MDYSENLSYEIEMLSGEEAGPDDAMWKAFSVAYANAIEELARTMSAELVKLLNEESDYYHNSLEEQQRLVSEGKAYEKYLANAQYPFRPPTRLWRRVRRMAAARALGDTRPLIMPPEVARLYIDELEYGIMEYECERCGYEVPWGLRLTYSLFKTCPACGEKFWPNGNRPWSEANPDKSVEVYVWVNGSFSADIDALITAKFGRK